MKASKDLFSKQSNLYAKFRPVYPKILYDWLLRLTENKERAWDCGTGNGQVAVELAKYFQSVEATDISQKQIGQATKKKNITYQVSRSETTPFPGQYFDLITVAQAIHWFDFDAFYREAIRVMKPNGILAVWGYGLLRITPEINVLLDHYYTNVIGPYWAPERKHIDVAYSSIDFPFEEILPPETFYIETSWTLDQFDGYLHTWSALQSYLDKHDDDPAAQLVNEIRTQKLWKDEIQLKFPIFTKVGRLA